MGDRVLTAQNELLISDDPVQSKPSKIFTVCTGKHTKEPDLEIIPITITIYTSHDAQYDFGFTK